MMYVPYEPRPIAFVGVREVRGYGLKEYAIVFGGGALDRRRFEDGLALACEALPATAAVAPLARDAATRASDAPTAPGRPGVGFVIAHQGRTGDYVVLCWWDNENELPIRVFVRDADTSAWRPARGSESLCVWDLEVIWFERCVYIDTVLRPGAPLADALPAYLGRHLMRPAS